MSNIRPFYTLIDVAELKVGMTTYLRDEDKHGNPIFSKEHELKEYFITSDKIPTISFRVEGGRIVIWRNSGKVWVHVGRSLQNVLRESHKSGSGLLPRHRYTAA